MNTRTGEIKNVKTSSQDKSYAVVLKCGHCGTGYFIPVIFTITASSSEMAVEIAKKLGRVKKTAKNMVLGITMVDRKTYLALEHINDCDPYFYTVAENVPDLHERRVAMEGLVDFREYDTPRRNTNKIPKSSIKTADQYEDKYVLQRYFAPVRYGEKLVYRKKVDMKKLIDEYLYYNTIELGIKRQKVNALSFYYQIYGENNELGISYTNGVISYKNKDGDIRGLAVPEGMTRYLDESKKEFETQSQEQPPVAEEAAKVKKPSATEKFMKRYETYYKKLESDKVKTK